MQQHLDAAERPIVVSDSTATFDYPWLKSNNWSILLGRAKRGDVILAVPEVVLYESVRRFRRDKAPALGRSAERRLKSLLHPGFDAADLPGVRDLKAQQEKVVSPCNAAPQPGCAGGP